MNRRDFLKKMALGALAASTTTYFDMGRGLWRRNEEILLKPNILIQEAEFAWVYMPGAVVITDQDNHVLDAARYVQVLHDKHSRLENQFLREYRAEWLNPSNQNPSR